MLELYRALVLSLGGAVLGLAGLVVYQWAPIALRGGGAKAVHVALIACAFSGLVVFAQLELGQRLLEHAPFGAESLLVVGAYLVALYALVVILRDIGRRRGP
jgi:hypothetical protein